MPFPDSPRVVYRRNTLQEVICQVRFPAILRIDSDSAAFQERVRSEYPLYSEVDGIQGPSLPPEIAQLLRGGIATTKQFGSADEKWKLGLTREFLALSTPNYTRWEEFRPRLAAALRALDSAYSPSFFVRVGLRYRNLIDRAALGFPDRSWADLLRPHVAAELSSEMAHVVAEATHVVVFKLADEGGNVRLAHGLEKRPGENRSRYILDADFFTEAKTETRHVLDRLDSFHRQGGRLFRWCITDALHAVLDPEPIV